MTVVIIIWILTAFNMEPIASGDVCHGDGPALGIIEVTQGSSNSTYYVDDRGAVLGDGTYLYEESNGIWVPKPAGLYDEVHDYSNLQPGGNSILVPGDRDYCSASPALPDTLIY